MPSHGNLRLELTFYLSEVPQVLEGGYEGDINISSFGGGCGERIGYLLIPIGSGSGNRTDDRSCP